MQRVSLLYIVSELVVVWSVCSIYLYIYSKPKLPVTTVLMQCCTLLPQMLQEVVKLLYHQTSLIMGEWGNPQLLLLSLSGGPEHQHPMMSEMYTHHQNSATSPVRMVLPPEQEVLEFHRAGHAQNRYSMRLPNHPRPTHHLTKGVTADGPFFLIYTIRSHVTYPSAVAIYHHPKSECRIKPILVMVLTRMPQVMIEFLKTAMSRGLTTGCSCRGNRTIYEGQRPHEAPFSMPWRNCPRSLKQLKVSRVCVLHTIIYIHIQSYMYLSRVHVKAEGIFHNQSLILKAV